ncbi:protein NRT1/ PTR FAMILY 1.2-like [Rutidosis leptorrhynchoides]|uniref:protein NRT1/ PTR FAMILY 1.2-like n=1 Tax=Rutidosis leptorrhynchoides TaxID=125765 RepID=UPI003A99435C
MATFYQLFVICSSLFLISVGSGVIKSSLLAFGADQLYSNNIHFPERASFSLDKYISRHYQVMLPAIFVGCTGVVCVQEQLGWKLGFGVSVVLLLFAVLSFFLVSPLYVKLKASKGMFFGLGRVIVNSIRNRNLKLPSEDIDGFYNAKEGSHLTIPSRNGFFLQVKTMDRHLTPKFEIPAGQFTSFPVFFSVIWLALYDHIILPFASKIFHKPVSLSIKTRMGIGLLCSSLIMALSAFIESLRRKAAIQEGYADKPHSVVDISVFWILPKFVLAGVGNAFIAVGQTESFSKSYLKACLVLHLCSLH